MFETIEIPAWTVWVAGILAAIGLLDRILMPTVRWYFRRRMNKAISVLNEKLQLKIQPFKLTKRRVMIDRLAYDPQVIEAIVEHSQAEQIPYPVVEQMAHKYAREIVPSFSATGYFGVAIKIARWLSRSLYRVRLGYIDEQALKAVKAAHQQSGCLFYQAKITQPIVPPCFGALRANGNRGGCNTSCVSRRWPIT